MYLYSHTAYVYMCMYIYIYIYIYIHTIYVQSDQQHHKSPIRTLTSRQLWRCTSYALGVLAATAEKDAEPTAAEAPDSMKAYEGYICW